MKFYVSKSAYVQLDVLSRMRLREVPCPHCADEADKDNCPCCDGEGIVHEMPVDHDMAKAIENNLRNQGVPLGTKGTS